MFSQCRIQIYLIYLIGHSIVKNYDNNILRHRADTFFIILANHEEVRVISLKQVKFNKTLPALPLTCWGRQPSCESQRSRRRCHSDDRNEDSHSTQTGCSHRCFWLLRNKKFQCFILHIYVNDTEKTVWNPFYGNQLSRITFIFRICYL